MIPEDEHQQFVDGKRRARMDRIDRLPPDIRELVHEYGYSVVHAFLDAGVTKARLIRHLVETTLNELSATRGAYSSQGVRAPWKGGV